ncbi:MAG: CHAT domain-containing protein [Limnoraphis sp.]
MNIFEITIQRQWQADSWPVVVKRTSSGNLLPKHTTGTLHLCKDDFLKLTQLRHQPRKYGTLLGKALFQEDIRDAFIEAISSRTDNSQVRVLLCVEADDLKFLYWHWLCVPSKWDFLALNQRVPFSLYIPSHADRRFPPIGRRNLRALIFVANPEDLSSYKLYPFDATETVETIQTALGDIPSDVLAMTTEAVGKPTLNELCGQLTQQSYTLLHIVCHGQYRDGKTWLYFSGEENQVEPVVDTVLIERLDRLGEQRGLPHFVFLSACESAVPEAEQTEAALGGLGQRLVRELGIPAVIAMTQNITIKTAGLLSAEFYQRLYEHGEVDLSLVEATATLAERYDILFPALFNRLGGQPLFSETLDRDPTNAEIEQGLSSLEAILPKQAPILQDKFNQFQNVLKKTLNTNPEALSDEAQKDRQNTLQDLNSLCTEVVEISFNALALGELPPEYDSRCPFRGLYPFRTEDREFFFGRDELIQQLKSKLEKHNFLAVLGRSGSGKSSVVLAGLIPALRLNSKTQLAYLTPSNNPVEQLDVSLSKTPEQQLVIVDQFEELFTLCHDENSRIEFINRLIKLIKTQKVVITMRADFWGECAPYVQLKELMEAQQLLIAPMNSQELKQAMEQQAERVGLRFADGLSDSILDDVQAEPGAMPLLQHALQELWKRRHGRWLLWEEYRAIGGVKKAIARTADAVYHNLEPDEQDLVRNIFIRLTRLQENAVQGYERRDTRQRVKMEELVPTDSRLDQIKKLVNRLADARLVVINQQKVEVAHEALIQFWPTLRTWLEEDWQNLRLRQFIGQSASEWQEYERDESYLILRGRRLENDDLPIHHRGRLNFSNQDFSRLTALKFQGQEYGKYLGAILFQGEIETAFGEIPTDVLAVDGGLGMPTVNRLCDRLTQTSYGLLHIVGHGKVNSQGETILYWSTEESVNKKEHSC